MADDATIYMQAVGLLVLTEKASTSFLQRVLGISYRDAAEMMERAEKAGVVSPPNFLGKREVIAKCNPPHAQKQESSHV